MTKTKRKPKTKEKEKNDQLIIDKQTMEEVAKIGINVDYENDEQKEIKRLLALGKDYGKKKG